MKINIGSARMWLIASGLFFVGGFLVFPVLWMLLTSLRPTSELYASNPFIIKSLTFEHYWLLLTETQYLRWVLNSVIIASVSSFIALIIGLAAAYALGRLRFRGGGLIGTLVFATYLIPPVLLFIPLNAVVRALGMTNSLRGLILVYLTFLVPFVAWLVSSYFQAIPRELAEAARMDGASLWQTMILVDMPLVLPGVVSVFFFALTAAWQEFLYAFTYLRSSELLPIAVGMINELSVGDSQIWGQLMAGAIMGSLPIVVIFAFLMDYYVEGLTAGAVKG